MGQSNENTGNKTFKSVRYTPIHVLSPAISLILPILMSKTSFKRPHNDRNSGIWISWIYSNHYCSSNNGYLILIPEFRIVGLYYTLKDGHASSMSK